MSNAPYTINPPSTWVWRCSDASIAAGQISVLAALETLLVFCAYGWLAWHFERQWWLLLLSTMAAPIILLRSEESKARGVALLKQYWDCFYRNTLTRYEKLLLCFVASPIIAGLIYGLAFIWLPEYSGWMQWWRIAFITLLAFVGGIASVAGIAGSGTVASVSTTTGTIIGAIVGVASFVFSSKKIFYGVLPSIKLLLLPIFGVGLGIGIWIRGLAIRIYASLRAMFRLNVEA